MKELSHDSSFCLFNDFFCNIDRPILTLLKGSADIFANNTDTEKLDGTKRKDQNDNRGIAGNFDANQKFLQNHNNQVNDGGSRG